MSKMDRTKFRGAYRLSGTRIVENSHRTIKRMAARSGGESPLESDLTHPDSPYFTTDLRHCRLQLRFDFDSTAVRLLIKGQ